MSLGGDRRVLGDLTNSYRKRTFSSALNKSGDRHNVDKCNGAHYTSSETRDVRRSKISTKGKSVISNMAENCETWEDGDGMPLLSSLNAKRNRRSSDSKIGGLTPQDNTSSDQTSSIKETKNEHDLSGCELKVAPRKADGPSPNFQSLATTLNQHCLSEESSQELEEELQDYETDSDDFAKTSNCSMSPRKPSVFHQSVEGFGLPDKGEAGEEHLTHERFLGKSASEGPSRSPRFNVNAGVPKGQSNVHPAIGNGSDTSECMPDKRCFCSFCLKAAYMWTDLHYQDARGRLSALKKSKKLSISSEQRCSSQDNRFIFGDTNKANMLEQDLMQMWRSLFVHMKTIFGREASQLHSSVLQLKELREGCKRDLEATTMAPSDHPPS